MRFLFSLIVAFLIYAIATCFLQKIGQYNYICFIVGVLSATIVNPFIEWGLERE